MPAADLSPVPVERRTQSGWDLFLLFAAANIVATTLQVGASLGPGLSPAQLAVVIGGGALLGAGLVAALAPVGSRLGVPSMIAARDPLGHTGAQIVAVVLFVTNFAWIAVNNVIAAAVAARMLPFGLDERAWAIAVGVVSTAVVAGGPLAVRLSDRVAVPLMAGAGLAITWTVLRLPAPASMAAAAAPSLPALVDVVAGYQVSWLLMFADYSRFTASGRASARAVFLGLTLTALWLMPLGWHLARHAGSVDPGAMLAASGAGAAAALLVALATITTNFVNIYLSALAWRSVMPGMPGGIAVWIVGLVGTALGLTGGWLDRFAGFMAVVGALLVPVGGVLLAHFVIWRRPVDVAALYDRSGPRRGVAWPGLAAWVAGIAVYALVPAGATLPSLAASVAAYGLLARRP
jgi:purine-cytosine permease-like protein